MNKQEFDFALKDPLTCSLFERLKRHPKRVVFTEGEDLRILRVAAKMVELEIGVPILLGNPVVIRAIAQEHSISLEFVNTLDPSQSSDLNIFCDRLERIEKFKGMHLENAQEMMSNPHKFAAMMLQYGQADVYIGGNQSKPISTYRALQQLVKPNPDVPHLYALTLLAAPHLERFGKEGYILMADTGINPEPDVNELAAMAISSADLAARLFQVIPRIALLSHSTKGSNPTKSSRTMAAATELARDLAKRKSLDIVIDGELQADVALDPAAAERKAPHMDERDAADVLIFPNLDSAHISSKLLQHTSGAQAYGQFVMGLEKPAGQIPVTASIDTILGTVAALSIEAISLNDLAR